LSSPGAPSLLGSYPDFDCLSGESGLAKSDTERKVSANFER